MAGYIGSKSSVTLVDGYSEAEADAEFVNDPSSVITVSGSNVGIGTTSPDTPLEIQIGSSGNAVKLSSSTDGIPVYLAFEQQESGTKYVRGRIRAASNGADGGLIFESGSSGSMSERLRITSAGNVGINTNSVVTSTGTNLQVTCTTGNARLVLDNTTTNGQEYRIYSGGAGELSFYNTDNNTERMQISSAGHVFLGGGGFASGASFFAESSSGGTNSYRATTNSGVGLAHYYSNVGGTQTLKAYVATNGTFNTVSDYRIKENVTEITDGISRINALRPVSYNQIGTDLVEDGFLAHELQEVIPHLVTGDKDGLKDDGSMFIQSVNHQGILATLVSAIKEQQETITDLQTEIASLKTRVEALEA